MRHFKAVFWVVIFLIGSMPVTWAADASVIQIVHLNNGDHITGTVETSANGQLMFHNEILGSITLDPAHVEKLVPKEPPVKIEEKPEEPKLLHLQILLAIR